LTVQDGMVGISLIKSVGLYGRSLSY
jgi:hypothetical protein